MKKIALIGAYDKTDLILYSAKIFTMLNKRVLVIDATRNQKTRYIVPTINPTVSYITEFERIDVAVGFANIEQVEQYLGAQSEEHIEQEYDIVLIDIDTRDALDNFEIDENTKKYFVTSFDTYSLKKGLEILRNTTVPMEMTKVLYSESMSKEEDEYLDYLSLGQKSMWNEYKIYFPIENGDLTVLAENQRISRIKFKKLSIQYKDGLVCLVDDMDSDINEREIRNSIKMNERGE
jgi:hypothetical protein